MYYRGCFPAAVCRACLLLSGYFNEVHQTGINQLSAAAMTKQHMAISQLTIVRTLPIEGYHRHSAYKLAYTSELLYSFKEYAPTMHHISHNTWYINWGVLI